MTESRLVGRLGCYAALTDAEKSFLGRIEVQEKPLGNGQTVVRRGSNAHRVFVLKEGWAIIRSEPVRGRSSILWIHLPGEVIGLGDMAPSAAPHTIHMQTDGVVCPFSRDSLGELLRDLPRLSALLVGLASLDQIAMRDHCAALGLMTAEDRLVRFLLQLRLRLALADSVSGDRFHLPFNQAEIGEAVGMTSVYVNKLLRKLSEQGLIRVEKPYMRLLDRAGLEAKIGFVDRFSDLDQSWFPNPRAA
ncbi:CRP-like cAMP-binding protein [Hasllibacter halocynthiae]|uniref:CRP-like cAMP-binding protein n=1 Tax=Hasllibacter halocynthiae TaxID=595589 RepID=A0A2T0X9S0_9RHOB|nr:Crp/Fnr family transcriptional regulator [Hasllibacter halocynthiae]PRY95688.1 CRP-like cAMP-binding protein [Hasllibacter halocynthiae]